MHAELRRVLGRRIACISVILGGCAGVEGDPAALGTGPEGTEVGAVPSAPAEPTTTGMPGANGAVTDADCSIAEPGPSPLRRLTRFEYNNTVRDLLKDTTRPADALPPEELGNGFGNDADALGVSPLLARQYDAVAAGVAARAADDPAKFQALVGCDPDVIGETECAQSFIQSFGARAYRMPVEASDAESLLTLFTALRTQSSFDSAIQGVIQAMLQSPRFLYRVEFGQPVADGAPVTQVAPYELASRLSYLLWGSMPDEELFQAAAEGRLNDAAQVRVQAERMLKSPTAREVVQFFNEVLFKLSGSESLQKNPESYPQFKGMAPLLKEETLRFLDHVIWEGEGDLGTLLSANYSFMNAQVAAYYGIEGPLTAEFERVELNPKERAGILTQALPLSILTPGAYTNPTIRGVFILERLLCTSPPDPPPNLNPKEPEYDEALTTRQRFAVHSSDPACSGCHQLMDPYGFALENFDGAGIWRTTDNGQPIDASAQLLGGDISGPVNGPIELMNKLASSEHVADCMVRHWFTFAYGRGRSAQDSCNESALQQRFSGSGSKFTDLLIALTQTDAFLFRNANSTPEGLSQ